MAILSKVYLGSTAIGRIALGANIIDLLPFFDDDPGLVTTNGARLTTDAPIGTQPPAMAHGVWITAPEVLAAEANLWLSSFDDEAGTFRQAYVTFYDDGARLVSIYTRDGAGVIQPGISEYIATDPIQPGDKVFLALAADAGGALHSYQSRNGADFTRGAGVAIPAGHTMPVYDVSHRFYDSDNVHTEMSALWSLGALPGAFADLASMNAAKASFVTADGSRATLNDIYGILGEPLHTIYGTAADFNAGANRGTSGGIFTVAGTFTDYAPPDPYALAYGAEDVTWNGGTLPADATTADGVLLPSDGNAVFYDAAALDAIPSETITATDGAPAAPSAGGEWVAIPEGYLATTVTGGS